MRARSYIYNVVCDVCGFEFKSNQLRKRWDGHMVCDKDWEARHPQDFLRVRNDTHKLPYIRDETFKARVQISITADITPVAGTWTLLAFDSEIADQFAEFNTGTSTFQPNADGSRTFQFGYALTSTGGSSSLEIALYKNGNPLKVIPAVYTSGNGTTRIGASYIDSTALSTDLYTVRYRITTLNGVIDALPESTYFRVD